MSKTIENGGNSSLGAATRDEILAGDIQMRRSVGIGICLVLGIAVAASCGGRSVLDPDDVNNESLGAAGNSGNESSNGSEPGDSGEAPDGGPGDPGGEPDTDPGRPDRPGDEEPGDGGPDGDPGFPGGDGPVGDALSCMSCVQEECPELAECLADTECRDGLMCAVQDCMGGGGGGQGGPGGPGGFDMGCIMGCFGGNMGAARDLFQGVQCAMGTCGDSCGSLLDMVGGEGGGIPGFP